MPECSRCHGYDGEESKSAEQERLLVSVRSVT